MTLTIPDILRASSPALVFEWMCPTCKIEIKGFSVPQKRIAALVKIWKRWKWYADEHRAFAYCFRDEVEKHIKENHG